MAEEHHYALPPGHLLHHYRVLRLLGHGGFGLTYLAEDGKLGRKVAVKELLPLDFAVRGANSSNVVARTQSQEDNMVWARQRFLEEGRTLASLHHPAILPIHEILETNNTVYLVTEFIDGPDFEGWLRDLKRPPTEEELERITWDLLDALGHVHAKNYLHRDIKPQNILIRPDTGRPVLIDFGNARVSAGERTQSLTAVLSRGYAPFEQYQTRGRQGPYTDLYALGGVLFRAITGGQPEEASNRVEHDTLPILSRTNRPGFSRAFLSQVDKALMRRRDERWQSAQDWMCYLQARSEVELPAEPGAPTAGQPIPLLPPVPARTESTNPSIPTFTARPITIRPGQTGLAAPPPVPAASKVPLVAMLVLAACVLLGLLGYVAWKWQEQQRMALAQLAAEKAQQDQRQRDEAGRLVREAEARAAAAEAAKVAAEKERQRIAAEAEAEQERQRIAAMKAAKEREEATAKVNADEARRASYSQAHPFVNTLGMEFVPLPNTRLLICRTETRVKDFAAFVAKTGWTAGKNELSVYNPTVFEVQLVEGTWKNLSFTQTEEHPVAGVSWYGAHDFVTWLSTQEVPHRYRLPSATEWTAALAGAAYCYGGVWPPSKRSGNFFGQECANAIKGASANTLDVADGYPRTSPVRSFDANRLGLYDLGGNLWEWCEDNFSAEMNPTLKVENAPSGAPFKVIRGGSWLSWREAHLKSDFYNRDDPAKASEFVGFRLVVELDSL